MAKIQPPQALLKVTLKKIPTLELVLDFWWAHQDLSLGPNDNKTIELALDNSVCEVANNPSSPAR